MVTISGRECVDEAFLMSFDYVFMKIVMCEFVFSNTFITSGKPQSEVKTHKE